MYTLADHYFSSCLDYLEAQGLHSSEILTAINFTEYRDKKKVQLAARISLDSYSNLLEYAKQTLNDPLIGFNIGRHIRTADYGVLGYLIESSTNLASAIASLLNYDSLVADIGKVAFEQTKNVATISWLPNKECSSQVVLRNMTAWVSVIRQLINVKLSPKEIYFTQDWNKSDKAKLSHWFKCRVESNANTNQISFPAKYLTIPFKTDNTQINLALKQVSDQQLSSFKSQQLLTEKINHIFFEQETLTGCNLIRTAELLNMTPRTVQRHLKQENTGFVNLLDNERRRRLPLYMNNYPLSEVASKLGFNDQSSFNRAFKRWYKCSPLNFLKNNLSF